MEGIPMGTLIHLIKNRHTKNFFILDRNDGRCYICKNLKGIERFLGRYIERVEQPKSGWIFVILDRIPKGGYTNE